MGSSLGSQPSLPEVDLSEKTIVVTGANTGIGYETAKTLAQLGAKVVLACRSETKGNEAIERMRKEHEEETADKKKARIKIKAQELDLEFMTLDLGSLVSVMDFVEAYKAKDLPLHVLVCNAGMNWGLEEPTTDGFEIHFQVNYLAHFLLVLHLLPVLKTYGPGSRLVLVSSLMHRFANWNVNDIQCFNVGDHMKRYAITKLYQIMQMFSLAQRLEGSGISVFSLHPGIVDTTINNREGQQVSTMVRWLEGLAGSLRLLRTAFDGALTSLHAAINPQYDDQTALYFDSSKPTSVTSLARNKENQEILWKYSLECLKDYVTEDTLKELTSHS